METSGSSPKQGPVPGKEIVPYQHAGELAINPVASGQEMVVYGKQAQGSPPALEPPSSYGHEGAVPTQSQAPTAHRGSEVAARHERQIVPHGEIPLNGPVRPIPREDEGAPDEAGPSLSTAGRRAILESLVKTLGKGLQHGAEGQPQADDPADPEALPETIVEEPATEELRDDEKSKRELRVISPSEFWESLPREKEDRQATQLEATYNGTDDGDEREPAYVPPQKRRRVAARPNWTTEKDPDKKKEEIVDRIIDLLDELESKGNPHSRPVELLRPANVLEKKFRRLRPDEYTTYSELLNSPKNTTFGNMVRNLPHNWRKADAMNGHVAVDDTIGWAISRKLDPSYSSGKKPSTARNRIITVDGQVFERFADAKDEGGFAVVEREAIPLMKASDQGGASDTMEPVPVGDLDEADLKMIERYLAFFNENPSR